MIEPLRQNPKEASTSGLMTDAQKEQFHAEGYVTLPDAVTGEQLEALRGQLADWVAESRSHTANYGECIDGRPRFDLEAGHNSTAPKLRRINNPAEVSETYRQVAFEARTVDYVAALIGPDIKFHHCKINVKRPRSDTRVGYHQDFSYTPHTNLDLAEALLLMDDMTPENGCLRVIPGSHLEGQVSLWHGGRFTGEIEGSLLDDFERRSKSILAPAGSVCLMHPLLMHGSDPNRSPQPRSLFICCYTAADAFPLAPSPLPNRFEGAIVRGRASPLARLAEMSVELPDNWKSASFFEVQGQKSASTG